MKYNNNCIQRVLFTILKINIMKKIHVLYLLLMGCLHSYAGALSGVVYDGVSKKPVDNGIVTIFNAAGKRSTSIQVNGDYFFSGLSEGTYTVCASSEQRYDTIFKVQIYNEEARILDLYVFLKENALPEAIISVTSFAPMPLIDPINPTPGSVTPASLIKNMGAKSVTEIVALAPSTYVGDNNEISIKGARPTATRVMIDGIYSLANVPTTSIRYVKVYSGGIPAKYGDVSGGLIMIETKSYYDYH